MLAPAQQFGLYLHIPYCAALCPYCDFAKTANFTRPLQERYLAQLTSHLRAWLEEAAVRRRLGDGFTSVFFGGGTPSLFGEEYAELLALLQPHLAAGCELSLEANPDDISRERLAVWRGLGFTRLSLGVQTFSAAGLAGLKRTHSSASARAAIEQALAAYPRLNIDLIYGWPGQSLSQWQSDLTAATAMGIQHLSLYNLTYEGRTPLARLEQRGRIARSSDDLLADMYAAACEHLGAAGYEHEEVSNWAKPGASCRHNWLYWRDAGFVGIGAGAHGYVPDAAGPGLRYAYERSDRAFIQCSPAALPGPNLHAAVPPPASDWSAAALSLTSDRTTAASAALATHLSNRFAVVCEERSLATWFAELVGAGLRTRAGIAFDAALQRTGLRLIPTPVLNEALSQGLLWRQDGQLFLRSDEWFREAGWGVEILRSCVSGQEHAAL